MRTGWITILLAALTVLASALMAGCGDETAAPGETVKEMFAAYNARDFGKVYDMSSTALQQQAGDREKAIAQMEAGWPPGTEITELEIIEEKVEGDSATVTWSGWIKTPELPDEPAEATVDLVKEDGEWRLGS